jgi:pyruvate,water dikinase
VALADEVDADPGLKEWFDSTEPGEIIARFEREGRPAAFRDRFLAFLDKHGHRFLGRDIRHATWRERPETVVEMIRMNLRRDLRRTSFALQRDKRANAEEVLKARTRGRAFGRLRWALFSLLLSLDRKYFVLRENMRYFADIYLEQFRRIYIEIGRRRELEGRLPTREDIVFLGRQEIEETQGRRDGVEDLIAQRKAEYERGQRIETPEVIREGEDLPIVSSARRRAGVVLCGEVASPGCVAGPARIIREPIDLSGFRRGDILVARCTDPSWAPILPIAAGLVLEVGGLLSHGAIVAREYGIPALIRVEGAVDSLQDGDRIELDTASKCVRVCPAPYASRKPYPLDNSEQIK